MSYPVTWNPSVSALDLRSHLVQLEAERQLAVREGLGTVRAYMADLDAEVEHRRELYVAAARPRWPHSGPSCSGPRRDEADVSFWRRRLSRHRRRRERRDGSVAALSAAVLMGCPGLVARVKWAE